MATLTPRLGMVMPDPADTVDVTQLNNDLLKVDNTVGATPCTHATRPATPVDGQIIREHDTGNVYIWDATSNLWALVSNATGGASGGGLTGISTATVTGKGDLIVGASNAVVSRFGVGANGQVLTADSTQALGVKWAAAANGSGSSPVGSVVRGMGFNWPNTVVTYVNHWDQQTTTYVNRARPFQVAASHGVKIMRTFFGTYDSFVAVNSTSPGVSDAAWAALQEMLDTAAANGVQMILSNYLDQNAVGALGGTTYASWPAARVALTTNGSTPWNAFQTWLSQALSRFAGHPGVYAWEVVNEPGYMLGMDDGSITHDVGCTFVSTFQDYLKAHGAKMVGAGGRPLYDRTLLTDAQVLAVVQNVDYLDDHLYPTDTAANELAAMDAYAARVRTLLGRSLPVVLGEIGTDTESFFDAVTDGAVQRGWLPVAWGYDAFDVNQFDETDEPYVLAKLSAVNAGASIYNDQRVRDVVRASWAAVALTDAATIATDASLGTLFRVTLGGNRTLGNPTNPADGQRITWEIAQDATGSRTLTLDTAFALGTTISSVTLTTTASKRDFLTAVYNSATSKWYIVDFNKGY